MEPGAWAALAAVFVLGAMSPGPSLAVVLRNTMAGGRNQGVATGIGHGIGFGIYAFAAAAGIATALSLHDSTEAVLRWGGTAILIWLGFTFLSHAMSGPYGDAPGDDKTSSERAGFVQGFLVALFNPKILAWMLAIYAPFIEAEIPLETLIGMGVLGMTIDGTWYVTVATVLTRGEGVAMLRSKAHIIDGAMGFLMFLFAVLILGGWL
ncbi:MAG: LysE family translocator [Candidatus Thalassarchaeaceae archaeon]|nr:LysE family translocator [Candidatus Thalassarchaeaceae archaeon]